MIKAASLPIHVDLAGFSQALKRQGIQHRIMEESGRQVVWAPSERESRLVREALTHWAELEPEARPRAPSRQPMFSPGRLLNSAFREAWRCPVTVLLMLVCVVVAAYSRLDMQVGRVDFLFYPILETGSLAALLGDIGNPGMLLRTFTPMFLHFGELHLVFNMLWLWYFGRQLEPRGARWLFPTVILLTSFTANTAQYLLGGSNNFGGMSGVVYGLLGYAWILQKMLPGQRPMLSDQMFLFFVIMLVAMELLASSWIATAAHLGGLLSGLFLGIVVAAYRGRGSNRGGRGFNS